MFPWGAGVLVAAAGLAYWLHSSHCSHRAPVKPTLKEKKPPVLSPERPAQQLKVTPDPDIMSSVIEQTVVNSFYHAAFVSGLAIGYGGL